MMNAQLTVESGLGEAFSRHFDTVSMKSENQFILYASSIDTVLGSMIAIGSESALYLLEFVDRRGLDREIERLKQKTKAVILQGKTVPIASIAQELAEYFDGKLKYFKTPIFLLGSPFQQRVWNELNKIPVGDTRSYWDIANSIEQPTACRAVARANGTNQLAIRIPCHRVINKNGQLGGYAGGVTRKEWLLNLEASLYA